ncbi:hypothetical protein NIES267_67390 [Calothrix parasitica NIES-267]|uniref:Uncharacterized protein n=1 Tax=Calothrix parasitica NIES-267 TaxID=1973488 RepID=A0A1Z4M176_9CYAN|nr:hypothetical protein NIES267_67390 [Calothrix parasitica NIES-267]
MALITPIVKSNHTKTALNMKSKDWKKWCIYLMFASSSTAWCCTLDKVVKATTNSRQTRKGHFVSTISSLQASGLISKSFDKSSSNLNRVKAQNKKTTTQSKNTRLTLPAKISHLVNETDAGVQALIKKQKSIPIFSKSLPINSKSVEDAIISQSMQNHIDTIVLPSIDNTPTTYENIISPEFSDIVIPNQTLHSKSLQLVQNPEPPPKAPTSENVEENPPPLESQPTDFPATSPEEIEKKLDTLEDERSKRVEKLLQRLEENKQKQQAFNNELGTIIVQETPITAPNVPELKQPEIKPVATFKPVGYLLGRVGYFHTSNIFSSRKNAIDDGLIFSGLTLAAAPFKIAPKTYLNGSIDGNIIRYSKQSEFNYNQIRFNLGVYQQLTNKMYGEIGWNNQQLFYSKDSRRFGFAAGDKFLNENSFRLSLGRRDTLAPKLNLDSFYEFRLSLTNPPEKRNRVINYAWFSLNYYLQQSLRIGVDYQFSLSNFLERSREDQYHRISANLKYGLSELSSVNLQSGFTLGGSTDRNIDFDGWFLSINYSWDIGQF